MDCRSEGGMIDNNDHTSLFAWKSCKTRNNQHHF